LDTSVIDAIKRWPNVPAAWGWLSLTCRGEWRLYPLGDAAQGGAGESITNEQIIGFINRNYMGDDQGQWLFQNGPQKVYVRLDSTPYILRTSAFRKTGAQSALKPSHTEPVSTQNSQSSVDFLTDKTKNHNLINSPLPTHPLVTHNGLNIESIEAWFVDQGGHVYALTNLGIGRVDDRDLLALSGQLHTPLGQSLDNLWPTLAHSSGVFETHHTLALSGTNNPILEQPRRLFVVDTIDTLARQYGFTRNPMAHA
jgi:hypothetical protein